MRIGLVFPGNRREPNSTTCPHSGVGVYVHELIRSLIQVDHGQHEYFLIGYQPFSFPQVDHPRVHKVTFSSAALSRPARYSGFWEAWAVRNYQVDLIHESAPGSSLWRWSSRPVLLTVHDLTPIVLPETFPLRFRLGFRLSLRFSARKAAHIVCMSKHTRSDLGRVFPGVSHKSTVIPLAPQRLPYTGDNGASLEAFGIRKPYLLSVSTLEPRKNHTALFDALAILQAKGCDYQLVCAGGVGWKTRTILSHPALHEHRERIVFTGPVDCGTLGRLYRCAEYFVYPTFYEGFGLPPLEALAAGVPAVVSRNSSLPEVLGDAPYWLSPRPDGDEIAAAVMQLADQPRLRRQRIEEGCAQASRYNWTRTALDTLSLYDRIAKKNSRR